VARGLGQLISKIKRIKNIGKFYDFSSKPNALSHICPANTNASSLALCGVPFPPLGAQPLFVTGLEAERTLVEANRKLITRMEAKIKDKLAAVWDEEVTHVG
jgi:hypothetical protein